MKYFVYIISNGPSIITFKPKSTLSPYSAETSQQMFSVFCKVDNTTDTDKKSNTFTRSTRTSINEALLMLNESNC